MKASRRNIAKLTAQRDKAPPKISKYAAKCRPWTMDNKPISAFKGDDQ